MTFIPNANAPVHITPAPAVSSLSPDAPTFYSVAHSSNPTLTSTFLSSAIVSQIISSNDAEPLTSRDNFTTALTGPPLTDLENHGYLVPPDDNIDFDSPEDADDYDSSINHQPDSNSDEVDSSSQPYSNRPHMTSTSSPPLIILILSTGRPHGSQTEYSSVPSHPFPSLSLPVPYTRATPITL